MQPKFHNNSPADAKIFNNNSNNCHEICFLRCRQWRDAIRTVTHIAQIEFYWSSLSCQFHYFVLHNLVFVSFWIRCVCNMISAHKVKHVNIYLILFHRVHTQNLQATRISKTQFSKKREKSGTFFFLTVLPTTTPTRLNRVNEYEERERKIMRQ